MTNIPMTKITCIIIDDVIEIRKRLESLLLKFENIEVLANEGVPEHAIEKVVKLKPDIVFIDVEMPRLNGFDVIKAIREKQYYPTFIFVTAFNQYAIEAIKKEAFDYLLKPIRIDELKEALNRYKKAQSGKRQVNIMDSPLLTCLSEREKEVFRHAIDRKTSYETAEEMNISKATVDTHRKKIIEKTGYKKISDLIIKLLGNQE